MMIKWAKERNIVSRMTCEDMILTIESFLGTRFRRYWKLVEFIFLEKENEDG